MKEPLVVRQPTTLRNYFRRTFDPRVLMVVHATGNLDVIREYPDGIRPGQTAYREWLYASRNPQAADGPSAHDYAARDGQAIEMLDPRTQVAWSNGDLVRPRTDLPGVDYLAGLRARGINANRGCWREVELVADPRGFDPTDEQLETCAWWLARDAKAVGLPITVGETLLTHAWINTVDRQNCAFRPAIRDARMAELEREARKLLASLEAPAEEEPMARAINAGGRVLSSSTVAVVKSGAPLFRDDAGAQLTKAPRQLVLDEYGWPDGVAGYRVVGVSTALFDDDPEVESGIALVREADCVEIRAKTPDELAATAARYGAPDPAVAVAAALERARTAAVDAVGRAIDQVGGTNP